MKPTPHILSTLKSHWIHPDNVPVNANAFIESLHHNMSMTIHSLKSKMNDAKSNKRAKSDRQKFRSFEVGELVMRKIPGLQSCFYVSWEGPYKIVTKLNDANYKIVSCKGKSHPSQGYSFEPFKEVS